MQGNDAWWVPVLALALTAFWCSTALRGTVRAVLGVFPIAGLIFGALRIGIVVGRMFSDSDLLDSAINRLHPFPFTNDTDYFLQWLSDSPLVLGPIVTALLLPVGAIQSYRFFRSERGDSVAPLIRPIAILILVVFFAGFSAQVPVGIASRNYSNTANLLQELAAAVNKLQPDISGFSPDRPLTVSLKDLASTPLSPRTRMWLANSSVRVIPTSRNHRLRSGTQWLQLNYRYVVLVNLGDEWKCQTSAPFDPTLGGWIFYSCESPKGVFGFGSWFRG
jgi:hypothetical protein